MYQLACPHLFLSWSLQSASSVLSKLYKGGTKEHEREFCKASLLNRDFARERSKGLPCILWINPIFALLYTHRYTTYTYRPECFLLLWSYAVVLTFQSNVSSVGEKEGKRRVGARVSEGHSGVMVTSDSRQVRLWTDRRTVHILCPKLTPFIIDNWARGTKHLYRSNFPEGIRSSRLRGSYSWRYGKQTSSRRCFHHWSGSSRRSSRVPCLGPFEQEAGLFFASRWHTPLHDSCLYTVG